MSILYAEGKELSVRERWKYHDNRDTCWSRSHFVERNRLDRVERTAFKGRYRQQ